MIENNKPRSTYVLKLAGAGLGALLLSAAVWFFYRESHNDERENAASQYGYERFMECLQEGHPAALCRSHREKYPYEKSSAYYDLKAQQEMAEWALIMLIVTSVGIGFVAMTLKTASDANEGFRASAEVQLRPYMSFQHIQAIQLVTSAWSIQAVWKNTGQTPTRQMTMGWGYRVQSDDLPDDFDYPDTPKKPANEGTISIGAQGVVYSNGPVITAQEMKLLVAGKTKVFYWGWIEYHDGFQGSPRRRSEFCQRFIIVPDKAELKTGFIAFGPHNGADEDCLKQAQKKSTS